MVTEDTFKITGEFCAKTNPLFSYSSKILRDWITSIYCKVCPNVLWFFLPFPLYKKILINKPGSQFSTINKFYVQATVAFMSVRCKSKFTSYVKHYTRREKQGWFLVLKDICVSIKSASCVLIQLDDHTLTKWLFVSAWRSVRLNCFPELHLFQGALGKPRTSPCFTTSPMGTQIFLLLGLWSSLGRARYPEAPGWQELSPNWSCASTAESQAAWWSLVTRRKRKKQEKTPLC